MSALKSILLQEIATHGPMSLATYMQRALTDPQHGYYMQRRPFGAPDADGGDFITAPEVSQMFGELIGAWLADLWDRMGRPTPFCLAELGPGRGTLMADVLRAASVLPDFGAAAQVHFIEVSPALRDAQKQAVPKAVWHDDLTTLPALPTLVVANEFFDALPIHQFKKTADSWDEIHIEANGDKLAFVSHPTDEAVLSPALKACLPPNLAQGDIVEACPTGEAHMAQLSGHIATHGGAALIIDYGHAEVGAGDSFQALERHEFVDPLAAPGMADLTAHVNFPLLAHIAQTHALKAAPITRQGAFLEALGLNIRAQQLMQASPERERHINDERLRLAAPQHMGELFKVLAVGRKDMPPFAGFTA